MATRAKKSKSFEDIQLQEISSRPLRVLIVEDEPQVARLIELELSYEGYQVNIAKSGKEAIEVVGKFRPDLIIMNWILPDINGLEITRRIRSDGNDVPLIVLSEKNSLSDKVMSLDSGADDYITKPFATEELLARIRAVIRRKPQPMDGLLEYKDLSLDQFTRVSKRQDTILDLRAKEFALLRLFMLYPEQVLTREFIFDKVWGYNFLGESNVIEVYVRYLRTKLESIAPGRLLHTVRGVGYILKADHKSSDDDEVLD
ncbi:MAG: response regulator transcription factor [Candidatus Melainabacteria bacterium]|nr:response regulator transcription factor [Candidatus Melainabacteria bacterium]